MLFRLLFKILLIYAIWQVLRMLFNVNKAQKKMQRDINDLHDRGPETPKNNGSSARNKDEGEYIDYEEIK